MKLFQRLLVAPAALGLMFPMVANASEEFNDIANRVDSIEENVDEFEAGTFSTGVTTLNGKTNFVIGGYEKDGGKDQDDGAITFNYSTQLNLNSSFFGDDLLYTRLKTGNFNNSAFAHKTALIVAIIVTFGTTTFIFSFTPAASKERYIAIVPLGTATAYSLSKYCFI